MLLVIDNYDSFVFNLARYFRRLGVDVLVVRNDAVDADRVAALRPAAVVLSPGPCTPREAGCCLDVVQSVHRSIPVLGVCLGHQAVAAAFGARVIRAPQPMHGMTSVITHDRADLFAGVPCPLTVGRYHSLIVDRGNLPDCLRITAESNDGLIMALQHRDWPVFGVQFHPESVLTEAGYPLLANFLSLAGFSPPASPKGDDVALCSHTVPAALPSQPITF